MAIPDRFYQPPFESGFYLPRFWPTWLLLGVMWLGAVLPLRVTDAFGAALGHVYYRVNRKRRDIARVNIELCFPELDAAAQQKLLRAHFRAAGRSLFGMGLIWWGSERRLERCIRIEGQEHLREAAAAGRGIIVLTGHFLTADLGGIFASQLCQGIVMMKEIRNRLFNWFIQRGRTRYKARTTLRDQGLRPLVRALRKGWWCYYVPDEDFGIGQSVFAPFMGIPAATVPMLGRLANMGNAVVVPCFVRPRTNHSGFDVVFEKPLADFPTGDEIEDARLMNEALERGVRMAPEQYMWTFRWFKTRPGNEPSPYA